MSRRTDDEIRAANRWDEGSPVTMAELLNSVETELDDVLAVIERVREMHRPWTARPPFCPECVICGPDTGRAADDQYPCATVRALDALAAPKEPAP
jgi:hypothetical protein